MAETESPVRSAARRSPLVLSLTVWLLGLVITGWLTHSLQQYQNAQLQAEFETEVNRIATDIERRFNVTRYGLMGVRGLFDASEAVSREAFGRFVASRSLETEFPGVRGMGFIEQVPRESLAAFEQQAMADGAPEFTVKTGGDAADLYIVKFIEPLANNPTALGLDVGAEPLRREAAETAVRTGQTTLTEVINLVQDQQARPGFLMYLPVYRFGQPIATTEQRKAALQGLAYSPIVLEEMLKPGLDLLLGDHVVFQIADQPASHGGRVLYSAGEAPANPGLSAETPLLVAGRLLTLRTQSTPALERSVAREVAGRAGLGTVLSTLLALMLWLQATSRSRAEARARVLTADLQKLALVAERTANSVTVMDAQSRISWINEGFTRVSGYTLEEARGKTPGELLTCANSDSATLALLKNAFAQGLHCRAEVLNGAKDGREYWVDTEVQPLWGEMGSLTGFIEIGLDVTERKEAERALLEKELKLSHTLAEQQVLMKALDQGTIFSIADLQGCIIDANHAFERISGYSRDELLGANHRLLKSGVQDDAMWHDAWATFSSGRIWRGTVCNRAKNGSLYWVESTIAPIMGADGLVERYFSFRTDITAQKNVELRLQRSDALLDRTSHIAKVGAWRVDLKTRHTEWSAETCRIHDLPVGHQPTMEETLDFYAPEARPLITQSVQQGITTGKGWDLELPLTTATGRSIWVRVLGELELEGGVPVALVGAIQDISEQKAQADALEAAKTHAEQASQFKSQFLANMSHEIRTPMNAILGMVKLLQTTALQPRQLDYVEKTEGAAKALLGLLNDILDFSKVEAGKMTLEPLPFELDRLLRDLSVIFSASVGNKPVEVLFDIDPHVPPRLVGDSLRLQQILINLGGNAIKFTSQGEVVVSVRLEESEADDGGEGPSTAKVHFAVKDSGIGIAPENQEKIFAGFTQAEASTTRRFGGTGLGLNICRRLVEMMGGQLHLESVLGQGSTFSFTVPLPTVAESVEVLAEVAGPVMANTGLKALVVDDNPMARELLGAMAESLGWAVEVADSGMAALEMVEAHVERGEPYQAVFVDWLMPGLDGWQTSARIRDAVKTNGDAGAAPLIMMVTAHGREMLAQQTTEVQALIDGYLVKPVTATMLFDAVQSALHPDHTRANQHKVASVSRPLVGLRLLVVEDNAINQQVAEELLSGQGAAVDMADNGLRGVEAVQAAQAAGKPYDLVLMDMQMPVMDGLTAARQIRSRLGVADLPIIAMTANAMASDRVECLEAGMNDHVGKPFDLEQLVATLLLWTKGAEHGAPDSLTDAPSTSEGTTATVREVAVLNRDGALKRVGGSVSLLNRLSDQFLGQLPGLMQACEATGDPQHQVEVQWALHTLKGVAVTIGADALADLAKQAELASKDGEPFDFANLQRVAAQTREQLAAMGISGSTNALEQTDPLQQFRVSPLTAPERETLQRLLPLLEGSDMGVFDVVDQLVAEGDAIRWVDLDAAVQAMEFSQAAVWVRRALQAG